MSTRTPRVAIVGGGVSGICMGVRLRHAGVGTFTIYEKCDSLGGTWRDNTYPGLTCDVPSRFYQFDFALNPDWSQVFAPGAEIRDYFLGVADEYRLGENTVLGCEVVAAAFVEGEWEVELADGSRERFDFVVTATGFLHHPVLPDIDGLDTFDGPCFHSARWDHDVQVAGKRVGVVGSGSTGVQIVCGLSGTASRTVMFQRTPSWIATVPNKPYSAATRWAQRRLPWLRRLSYEIYRKAIDAAGAAPTKEGLFTRLIDWRVRRSLAAVTDPELRRKLTPDYAPLCKRLVLSPAFYEVVQRDDVDVITDGILTVEQGGVRTADGTLHELDMLVLATGFDTHAYVRPMAITGADGVTLEETWAQGPRTANTVAVPGFPNLFMLMGPSSPVANAAQTATAQAQTSHVMHWIERWRRREYDTVSPRSAAMQRFRSDMAGVMPRTRWATGCTSWYIGEDGRPELFPWAPRRHVAMMTDIDENDYETAFLDDAARRPA